MSKLYLLNQTETNPYRNLAIEEYLLHTVEEDVCILYLWQNHRTVVIGRNQNAWKECRVEELEKDGGHLVRRLSGGGAVYHDAGNLNFTFLIHRSHYDLNRQTAVILEAVRKFGIRAEQNGRNDITVDGRKISGNAFYSSGVHKYHHGTILVRADTEQMNRYLSASQEKLRAKGVESVKARVCNLTEYDADITIELLRQALQEAFAAKYEGRVELLAPESLKGEELVGLTDKFSSAGWNFGRQLPFTYELKRRFEWGEVQLQLQIEKGRVVDAAVYSDALEESYISAVEKLLSGSRFSVAELAASLKRLPAEGAVQVKMAADLTALLSEAIS